MPGDMQVKEILLFRLGLQMQVEEEKETDETYSSAAVMSNNCLTLCSFLVLMAGVS